MELKQALKESGLTNQSRVYLAPHISDKLLNNALEAFPGSIGGQVAALMDNTMFGSGKDGCLMLSDRIGLREPFATPIFYDWKSINALSIQDGR